MLFKNEEGNVFPAIISSVNVIVDPPKDGQEQIRTELRLCVFDPDFGPKMYTTDTFVMQGAETWPRAGWAWPPRGEAVAVQVPYAQLKGIVDAAVAEALESQIEEAASGS